MFGLQMSQENFKKLMELHKVHNEVGLVLRFLAAGIIQRQAGTWEDFGVELQRALDEAYLRIQEADDADEAINKAKLEALDAELAEAMAASGRNVERKYEH